MPETGAHCGELNPTKHHHNSMNDDMSDLNEFTNSFLEAIQQILSTEAEKQNLQESLEKDFLLKLLFGDAKSQISDNSSQIEVPSAHQEPCVITLLNQLTELVSQAANSSTMLESCLPPSELSPVAFSQKSSDESECSQPSKKRRTDSGSSTSTENPVASLDENIGYGRREEKKIGRPKLDRTGTACYNCGVGKTSQWRYLETNNKNGKPEKLCMCNACWLRVSKAFRKRNLSLSKRGKSLQINESLPDILQLFEDSKRGVKQPKKPDRN